MRRTIWLLVGVLLVAVALGSDSPKEYDDKTTADPVAGNWWPLKVEVTNKLNFGKIICSGDQTANIAFKDGKYIWGWGDGYSRLTANRGSYTLNFSRSLGHLDLIDTTGPLAGVTRRCIYGVDGETLQIASMTDQPAIRPESFEGHVTIYTLKRVKK